MRTVKEYTEKHKDLIDDLLENRLFNYGTYADGTKIKTFKAQDGVYAPFTIGKKKEQGQPTDRVTLKDSGELYKSFKPEFGSSSFAIDYEDKKDDGNVSDNIPDLENAIQLGNKGLTVLREPIKTDMRDDYKQEARESILSGLR